MVTAPVTGEGCEDVSGKPGAGAPAAGMDEPNTKVKTKVERKRRARPTTDAQQPMVLLQLRKSTRSLGSYIPCPSAARLSGPLPDPWLCAPASRRVCLFSGSALRCKTVRLHGGCQGAIPSGQGPQYLEIAGAQEGA